MGAGGEEEDIAEDKGEEGTVREEVPQGLKPYGGAEWVSV